MSNISKTTLDNYEKDILEKFEQGELITTKNFEEELLSAKAAARNYLNKDKRINIRISSADLEMIKRKAAEEGLPYQTYISSTLHKLVTGRKIA